MRLGNIETRPAPTFLYRRFVQQVADRDLCLRARRCEARPHMRLGAKTSNADHLQILLHAPRPAMLLRASRDFNYLTARRWFVGEMQPVFIRERDSRQAAQRSTNTLARLDEFVRRIDNIGT